MKIFFSPQARKGGGMARKRRTAKPAALKNSSSDGPRIVEDPRKKSQSLVADAEEDGSGVAGIADAGGSEDEGFEELVFGAEQCHRPPDDFTDEVDEDPANTKESEFFLDLGGGD